SSLCCSILLTNRRMHPSNQLTVCAITCKKPTCCSRYAPRRRGSTQPESTAPDSTSKESQVNAIHDSSYRPRAAGRGTDDRRNRRAAARIRCSRRRRAVGRQGTQPDVLARPGGIEEI